MPRENKKTRVKGLPPKLQLVQRDNTSGSYPTAVKIASDNRSGKYNVFWNDNNTIVFDDVSDIRDGIINYYRFNSGSTSEEVTPNPVVDGTASFLIRPTFSNTASLTTADPSVTFTFQTHVTGNDAGFYTSASNPTYLPWFGPDYDPNLSSIDYYRPDYSFATGGLNNFNPGKNTAVSGAAEKPFSIAFWARNLDSNTPGIILSVARTNASWSAGTVSSASFVIEGRGTALQAVLFDSASNGIGININNALPGNTWRHVVFTYDGSTTFGGMSFYLDGRHASRTLLFQGTLGAYGGMQTSYTNDIVSIGALGKLQATIFGGDIDEMIFFNRVLNSGEIHDLYLSRVSIHTPSVENRFANGIYLGAGLPTNSPYWYNATVDDLVTDFTTSLYQTGTVKKGIGDNLAHFTPGQSFQPFRDLNNPAADGKSTGSEFYATGSKVEDVGPGFSQPLWSKSKIEIDISTVQSKTIGYRSGTNVGGDDFAMMYYNAGTKTYMPVGSRKRWDEYENASGVQYENFVNEKAIGFLPAVTIVAADSDARYFHQTPTSVFGFPYASKYFINPDDPVSSSILIPVSNYTSNPFLIEKIVVSFSCSHFAPDWETNAGAGLAAHAINTFFILNQRKQGKIQTTLKLSGSDFPVTEPNIEFVSTTNHNSGIMDLVTFNQFMFVGDTLAHATGAFPDNIWLDIQLSKEIKPFYVQDIYPGNRKFRFTGSMDLSGTVKSPTITMPNTYNSLSDLPFAYDTIELPSGNNSDGFVRIRSSGFTGGRNGLPGVSNPRNLVRGFESISEQTIQLQLGGTLGVPDIFARVPYMLQPGDQLIIGWQCAYPITEHSLLSDPFPFAPAPVYIGPELTINQGPATVTLYGSQIRNGEEFHDTLNQLLVTDAIHEVIE